MELVVRKQRQTELGVIPTEWEVKSLGEVGDVKMCRRIFNNDTSSSGAIPFFKIGTFGREPDAYISKEKYEEFRKKYSFPRKGDILISAAGTIGRTIVYKGEDAYFQDSNIVWIENDYSTVSNEFLYYVYKIVKYNTEGGTIQRLYNSILKAAKFALPTKAEQTAIATALSDMDALIAQTEKLIAKKKAIKQGMIQHLLSPYDEHGKLKEGWETKPLKEISWFQEGPGLRNWQFRSRGIKVINVTNLENGYLNLDRTDRHISLEEFQKMYQHFEIDENDIVVASSGNSYGKVAVVRKRDLPLLMNTSVIRFKPLKGLEYKFLLIFLKSGDFKKQIDLLITGGAQPNFGPAHLNKILISLPKTNEEQIRISNIISVCESEINVLEMKLKKCFSMKQGMMQNLLTGKIRIYKPQHESAVTI